jgi:hypothetical protein
MVYLTVSDPPYNKKIGQGLKKMLYFRAIEFGSFDYLWRLVVHLPEIFERVWQMGTNH